MAHQSNVDIGCRIVGEYVDRGEISADEKLARGENVLPVKILEYTDRAAEQPREFTVLLRDGRAVAVQGHGVKQLPPASAGESGSFGIFQRSNGEDVYVGLFNVPEVVGIFDGEVRPDRQVAF